MIGEDHKKPVRLKVTEVFVPGGLPKYTYVARRGRNLEEQLETAKSYLCKIATVTGATKSGKTVLVKKVFGKNPMVWIDGGHIHSEEDFWSNAGTQLAIAAATEFSASDETSLDLGAEMAAQAGLLLAKAEGKVRSGGGRRKKSSIKSVLTVFPAWRVAQQIKQVRTPVIIDDFHYLPRELQGAITRVLKPLVFEGVPVVYLAIPHRRYDAVKVEREMNGRIELIRVPSWTESELMQVPQLGFPHLRIEPDSGISLSLAKEAHGSPHLMQEFCRSICHQSDIRETAVHPRRINPKFDFTKIFRGVAKNLGKNIYEKLARGPRQRSDRIKRKLRSGQSADIYQVVLSALAHLKPEVATVEYEQLRTAIRAVLGEEPPQAREISRVLEQMAKVSSTDDSSVPVIDYEKDERRLHITDPFFAFFLRWGVNAPQSDLEEGPSKE
jgi:hypothetical protein